MALRRNKSGYQTFREDGKTQSVHKRVLEKKLGGKIWEGYESHHRDGNKDNNRPNNLQAVKMSSHRRFHARKRR